VLNDPVCMAVVSSNCEIGDLFLFSGATLIISLAVISCTSTFNILSLIYELNLLCSNCNLYTNNDRMGVGLKSSRYGYLVLVAG